MDDLIAFLRARLDEVEEEANNTYVLRNDAPGHDLEQYPDRSEVRYHDSDAWETMTHADYWERFYRSAPDSRVLAEVDAKRRILDDYEKAKRLAAEGHTSAYAAGELAAYETAVRALALPDAGHPDYREEWRS